MSNTISSNNFSIVLDNDFIDSPFDDRDVFVSRNLPMNRVNQVDFQDINVNTLINNSSVAIGENNMYGWSGHSKRNFGNGKFSGTNVTNNNHNHLEDNDYIDTPINDQDYKPGFLDQRG